MQHTQAQQSNTAHNSSQSKKVPGSAIHFKSGALQGKNIQSTGNPKKAMASEIESLSSTHKAILFKGHQYNHEIAPQSAKNLQQSERVNLGGLQSLGSGRGPQPQTLEDFELAKSGKIKQVNLVLNPAQSHSQYQSLASVESGTGTVANALKPGKKGVKLGSTQQVTASIKTESTFMLTNQSQAKQNPNQPIAARNLSPNSDKLNNSLLKLKSRNRCNDNFNLGGPSGSHGSSVKTKNSNIEAKDITQPKATMNQTQEPQSHQVQLTSAITGSGSKGKLAKNQILNSNVGGGANKNFQNISKDDTQKQQPKPSSKQVGSLDRKPAAPQQLDTSGGNLVPGKKLILQNEPLSCQNKGSQKEKLIMMPQQFESMGTLKSMQVGKMIAQSNMALMTQKYPQHIQSMMSMQADKFSSQPQAVGSNLRQEETKGAPRVGGQLDQKKSPNNQKHYVSRLAQNLSTQPIAKISKAAVKVAQESQQLAMFGQTIQTERLTIGSKLSLSNELSSARDVDISSSVNYSGIQYVRQEDGSTGIMISAPEGETGCSPKIHFQQVPVSGTQNQGLARRAGAGQSMPAVVSNAQKRRTQLNTGSYNKRQATEEGAHSSPSAGGGGHQANMSSSACNKSAHYGLSSQSFMTNSNSNGGSNPRQGPTNDVGIISQTGVNTSNYNTSFYNHQRQRSSGIQNQSAPSQSQGEHSGSNNAHQQPHTQKILGIGQMPPASINAKKKVAFGGAATSSNSSNPGTLSSSHRGGGVAVQGSFQQFMQQPLGGMASQTQKINFQTLQIHQTPVQVEPKAVQISNKQKKGATSNNSSRSNSIRKRENFGKVSRKQNVALKPNFFQGEGDLSLDTSQLNESLTKTLSKMRGLGQNAQRGSQQANPIKGGYTHTVEDEDFRDSLNHSAAHQFFSNDNKSSLNQPSVVKKGALKKKDAGNVNRSVIVEPSTLKGFIKFQDLIPSGIQEFTGKHTPVIQNEQEIETMKKELHSKDMVIQNLRDRLQNLEEKVNGISQQQQIQHQTSKHKEDDEEHQRDKSQQRIKDAIMNLERKLEQFRLDKEINHLKLEEIKQYSSSQHSSSRHSETQNFNQMGRNMFGNSQAQSHITRALNYVPMSGSSGFAGTSLGLPQARRSQNSLMDDLESLITITDHDEAVAKAIGMGMNKVSLGAIDHDKDPSDIFGQRYQTSAKIKTPMFEDNIGKFIGGYHPNNVDNLHEIIANERVLESSSDHQDEDEDNSCLLMLEKEWQEAQRQKDLEQGKQHFLGSGPKENTNLFDQSLIAGNVQLKNYNQTQNNIVFFFDEDTMVGANEGEQVAAIELDDIELAARGGKEKFIKTQKIELNSKEMASIAKGKVAPSLSPSQSTNIAAKQEKKARDQSDGMSHVSSNPKVGGPGPVAPNFSRTLSKTTLLAKIRNAIGKQEPAQQVAGVARAGQNAKVIAIQQVQPSAGNTLAKEGEKKTPKQPRRFIVKRSQERNASNNAQSVPHSTSNPRLKLKSKMVVAGGSSTAGNTIYTQQPHVLSQPQIYPQGSQHAAMDFYASQSAQVLGSMLTQQKSQNLEQQEFLMKTIVQQKEKVAQTQKDALKKERELSLKLRQAIQKLNLKIQMQSTNPQTTTASTAVLQGTGKKSVGGAKK